jgi:AcrR family transcriptional regulator
LLSDSARVCQTPPVAKSSRPYAGVDAGERRAARRARLMEAALDLLGREGWQATTVRAICSQARLTPRYFYESFADRDELLLALFDELAREAAEHVLEAVVSAEHDARAKAGAAIAAFVGLVTDDPRKARVLFVEAMGSEPLARRRFETVRMFARLVAEQGREFYGLEGNDGALVDTTALMLVGGLAETLLSWLDGSLHVTREQLIEDCTDLFVVTGEGALGLTQARG